MMQLLLHGPAKIVSRKKLIELKQKFDPNNVVVYEEGTDLQTIQSGLSSQSLFVNQQLIIVENPPEELQIANFKSQIDLILWFDYEIDPKKWSGFEVNFFPEGKEISVFPLLDLLATKNKRAFFELEKIKNAGFDIFYVLTMVFYLLRSLAVIPKRAPDFVKRKLEKQRAHFGPEKIKELYKDMLEIDFEIKSGILEKSQAEFLMVNKFLN